MLNKWTLLVALSAAACGGDSPTATPEQAKKTVAEKAPAKKKIQYPWNLLDEEIQLTYAKIPIN